MRWSTEQVRKAAFAAYRSSMSGDDDTYVENKSELFVQRCLNFDGHPDADTISKAAIEEIAFAALDPYCTAQLYGVLDRCR